MDLPTTVPFERWPRASTLLFDIVLFFVALPIGVVLGRSSALALGILGLLGGTHVWIAAMRYGRRRSVEWPRWTEWCAVACGIGLVVAPYTVAPIDPLFAVGFGVAGCAVVYGHARKMRYFEDDAPLEMQSLLRTTTV